MGSVIVNSLVQKAQTVLQDVAGTRWPTPELVEWLNLGQQEIVRLAPDANAITEEVKLVAGTKQSIPANGIRFIDLKRNVPHAGYDQSASAIRMIDRAALDASRPNWPADDADPVVKHYMFDPRTPRVFYVYPPQPASGRYVEISYSATPATVDASSPIALDDVYASALLDYMLYRAYSKDADHAPNAQRMMAHFDAFMRAVAGKEMGDQAAEPQQPGNLP